MVKTKRAATAVRLIIYLAVAPFMMGASGCPNAFLETANKTSDDALLFSAEAHANANEWSAAISDISAMTATGKAKRETKSSLASYYAGRCGLNLLNLAQTLKDQGGTTKLWPMVMRSMVNATALQAADCKTAEATMLTIDPLAANRTADENTQLAFIEFAKMGSYLASSLADADHDGTVDGTFDSCGDDTHGGISDAVAGEMGTGLTIMASALAASGFTSGGLNDTVTNVCIAADTFIVSIGGTAGFCNVTSAAAFTAPELLALRALMKSNEIGFNSCGGSLGTNNPGTSSDCLCPAIP